MGAFSELKDHFVLSRIFVEDEGVVGNGLFAALRTNDNNALHILGNLARVFLILFTSPIYLIYVSFRRKVPVSLYSKQAWWGVEFVNTPPAVLATAPSDNAHGIYQPSHLPPSWLLELDYGRSSWRQVPWEPGVRYTALSYPYEKLAAQRFRISGPPTPDQPIFLFNRIYRPDPQFPDLQDRHNELVHRQLVARDLLLTYMESRIQTSPPQTEYVWLDEFCLSDASFQDVRQLNEPRHQEVGRLADIFRAAEKVYIFCSVVGCNHTSTKCFWNTRLFTLAEIIHANKVVTMILGPSGVTLHEEDGRFFRERIQAQAAEEGRWHLYAIMQHSSNAGAVSWQTAIHALLVEAILRDEAGGYKYHEFLGRGLNGLLPRRARVDDLRGKDGWEDLAWLLELNQGFYNAASLAAVCGVAETEPRTPEHYWLGPPMKPDVGNERLEPCVTAFPIPSALNILTPHTIKIHQTLKRDPLALYRVSKMRGFKILAFVVPIALIMVTLANLATSSWQGSNVLLWLYFACISHVIFIIIAGSMYIHKSGWVLLRDEQWATNPPETNTLRTWLGHRDSRLSQIDDWGYKNQLTPQWKGPRRAQKVTLVDLDYNVATDSLVLYSERINAVVPLAVHGCGVTCMVLERPNKPNAPAHKVGMVNMPPYIRVQGEQTSTLYVGRPLGAIAPDSKALKRKAIHSKV